MSAPYVASDVEQHVERVLVMRLSEEAAKVLLDHIDTYNPGRARPDGPITKALREFVA